MAACSSYSTKDEVALVRGRVRRGTTVVAVSRLAAALASSSSALPQLSSYAERGTRRGYRSIGSHAAGELALLVFTKARIGLAEFGLGVGGCSSASDPILKCSFLAAGSIPSAVCPAAVLCGSVWQPVVTPVAANRLLARGSRSALVAAAGGLQCGVDAPAAYLSMFTSRDDRCASAGDAGWIRCRAGSSG